MGRQSRDSSSRTEVAALWRKEGDEIEIHVVDWRDLGIVRKPGREEPVKRLYGGDTTACQMRRNGRIVRVDTGDGMRTQIARWGNSLAVRLPRQVADEAGLGEGVAVEVDVVDGVVRVVPARPSYSLAELLAGISPENIPESFDDRPHGRESL